jgi:hypothetical protein
MKEIIIDISNEGEVKIETRGFKGKSCIAESLFLKDLLGKETERNLTPTYWEKEETLIKKYLPLCG